MKSIKILIIGMLLAISAGAVAQNLDYHITGKLVNISPMPAKMYLSELILTGMLSKPVDSSEVINGEYHFNGKLNADEAFGVKITPRLKEDNPLNTISLVVDKGDLMVTSTHSLDNYTVAGSGSTAHHQFEDMKGATKATSDSIKAIKASQAYKTDNNLKKEIDRKSMSLLGETIFAMYDYVKKHPENRVSPYGTFFLTQLPFLHQTGKDTLISQLPERVKGDLLGRTILKTKFTADSIRKLVQDKQEANLSKISLGSKSLDFTQNDQHGKPVSLSSFKGKYVLVDFWASWCAPCRAENPNVVKNYEQYKDKGFTVLGVSLDGASTKDAWIKAIEKDGLTWTQVSDLNGFKNQAAVLYDIKAIPQNFLIGPDGVVIAKNLRGDDLSVKLAAIFNK